MKCSKCQGITPDHFGEAHCMWCSDRTDVDIRARADRVPRVEPSRPRRWERKPRPNNGTRRKR
jgi:hypothetical protein